MMVRASLPAVRRSVPSPRCWLVSASLLVLALGGCGGSSTKSSTKSSAKPPSTTSTKPASKPPRKPASTLPGKSAYKPSMKPVSTSGGCGRGCAYVSVGATEKPQTEEHGGVESPRQQSAESTTPSG